MPQPTAPIGYYRGDDTYGVAHAAEELARRLADGGELPERWKVGGIETNADEVLERVATAPLFGAGTLVVVENPGPLVASKDLAARLQTAIASVAPGNGLAFLEATEGTGKSPAALETLRSFVATAGGDVRDFGAPRQQEMSRWIQDRAVERGIAIAPQAATELARRVGAFVRENDVDRRRQADLALAELEKLAMYRLDETIRQEDVAALVTDAVPGSTWAFLDAVAVRNTAEAAALAQRLGDLPGPVLVVHLHRRIRELILVGTMLARGDDAAKIVQTLKLNPYVARKLAEQVRRWTPAELDSALEGVLELDAAIKGDGGSLARVGLELWLAERVAPSGARQRG